jgi:hypothetical protein
MNTIFTPEQHKKLAELEEIGITISRIVRKGIDLLNKTARAGEPIREDSLLNGYRTNVSLDLEYSKLVEKWTETLKISKAEFMRRAVDIYFEKNGNFFEEHKKILKELL